MSRIAATLVVVAAVACSQTSNSGKSGGSTPAHKSDDAAQPADDSEETPMPSANFVELIVNKDFESWSGLPADARPEALAPPIELGKQKHAGSLGADRVAAQYLQARAEGYPELIKLWLRDERVVAIELELPQLGDPEALITSLGKPALELDTLVPMSGSRLPKGLRVYPERGLAARMSTGGDNITALWLFAPTTADAYQKTLAPTAEYRESESP